MSKSLQSSRCCSRSPRLGDKSQKLFKAVCCCRSADAHDLQGLSSLLLFTDEENAGKEEVDKEKVDGVDDGEGLDEEEEEEERGTDEDADPCRSLQFSESLPLGTFADGAAHDWGVGE